ncbi:transcriptional regulator, TetR family [Streptoalloteichus tenebrarius]|uniref:Transcriptional regulator, TetR family n=1 Tax=Streptoalloteichus tenebrarius (strain ATCC 17920 / DSM 40477 / JCM 4838 / CBS 697.72 / NBRC 16177 / NCIMB 11028 / NRRL B-12390 / A12253. 1 / ISP 5477) TaxID=1933 RepID=A0ABT1HMR0_STRSD|nr:TetR/AcrR family transcriptional regulator [Streptoalloteichus tenebrarius]MCP2256796.1 transcriptional regulator, TetR family [Streptoalloteichus tenebrarius]BFF00298.1 TetR/AcrR family transcriptional regulator [Streptoalloteichus tenebrarius]
MPRTKEFDPDVALEAALELFWERGYEATSMADLVERLGVARASIYATFGSKHDLYVKAVDRYLRLKDPRIVESLSQPGPVVPQVRALVERYVAESVADERRRGCLVVNAAVELSPVDPEVARRVGSSWDTLEVALTSALFRARAQGELSADSDPRALARLLLAVLQGIRVLAKGGSSPERLRDAAEQALRALR